MISQIRRVVTGKDARGKSIAMSDSMVPNLQGMKEWGSRNALLWVTDSAPAGFSMDRDAADRQIGIDPPPNGAIFRVVEFTPEKDISGDYNTRVQRMRERGLKPEGPSRDNPRHPNMHRTRTIDYAVVLSGKIDMLLDDSEVHLKTGDVLVQQGTNHAWVNRGDEPCQIAFIMIDAKE